MLWYILLFFSDFEIKYINESNGETSVLSGHEAPVLCVLPHPKDLLVSWMQCVITCHIIIMYSDINILFLLCNCN